MITINYLNKKYFQPSSWSEINLESYMKSLEVDENLDEIDKTIAYISNFSGIPIEDLEELPIIEFKKLETEMLKVINSQPSKLEYVITIDKKRYGMFYDITKVKAAEYLDLDHFNKVPKDIPFNFDYIMAIMWRPITKEPSKVGEFDYEIEKYDSETIQERRKIFKEHMSMDTVFATSVFFCNSATQSLIYTKDYLNQSPKTYPWKWWKIWLKKPSKQNGVGSFG